MHAASFDALIRDMFDSFKTLDDMTREAVVDLLFRLADDELIIGHQGADWISQVPLLDGDATFSSMALDEIAHAKVYYSLLHELGEPAPDTLAYGRKSRDYRCASLVSLPQRDWAFALLRRFFYDTAEHVRLATLSNSSLTPLALAARKLQGEEESHLHCGRTWVLRLAGSSQDARLRMQETLHLVYSHALGLFEPTEADNVLGHAGISEPEEQLCREWESAVAGVLARAGLMASEAVQPVYGGRVGRHGEALANLLESIRERKSG